MIDNHIEPVSLSDQRYRNELKYIVPLTVANPLMDNLLEYCKVDDHADSTGSYEIASVYYDTEKLDFYMDREESVPYRRKVRLRVYNRDGRSEALFVEIKERHKQKISKKRINLRNMDLLSCGVPHDKISLKLILDNLEDSAEAREIAYLDDRLGLEPIVLVRYIRKPLIPIWDDTIRLTLDTRITGGGDNLSVYDSAKERFVLPPDHGLFEVKTNRALPMWLQSVLMRHQLSQTRFSKYCLAVDAAYQGRKPWLRTREEPTEDEEGEGLQKKVVNR
ncbi:MAG: polyphosphate polymerase domain-containing protein [Bdellovibrionales bacterium]|nr:polyphosphate polymerase domain-containing protein [Bdellovibrionales bacterium]